ncbi:Hypothetical predicted protein [Pelobates cultripes]|uniref:UPAR/Ly6 domain-containing protein n=1 Tax=Pelobates cultripes TaxID=61616 RepID=A0AAD1T6I6_PELCU|nr:Hypothetical predicted protein [Pelobates cultripes]
MKIYIVASVFLFVLCSLQYVTSLQCFACKEMKNNTECNQQPMETCIPNFPMCLTKINTVFGHKQISKRCANTSECEGFEYNVGMASKDINCCTTDMCNSYGGQSSIQGSRMLAAAAFLVICVLKSIL